METWREIHLFELNSELFTTVDIGALNNLIAHVQKAKTHHFINALASTHHQVKHMWLRSNESEPNKLTRRLTLSIHMAVHAGKMKRGISLMCWRTTSSVNCLHGSVKRITTKRTYTQGITWHTHGLKP